MTDDETEIHQEGSRAAEDDRSGTDRESELVSISAQFAADLSVGQKPDIQLWLAKVDPDRQPSLLKRLRAVADAYSSVEHHPADSSIAHGDSATIEDVTIQEPDAANLPAMDSGTLLGWEPGTPIGQLGAFDLELELGRGGMGVVYRARQRETGEVVALKILPTADGDSLHRFKREFRSMAEITHPNLIGLRNLEQFADQWFFTMDLIEEPRSFQQFVRPNNTLNLARLRSAVVQLCEGVQQLHKRGILHRDLKPSNVLIDSNGRLLILDFGLVSELKRNDQTLTVQSVSGTPAFMSPEAAAAEKETLASDWYSVGAMLYQALSGKLPFEGNPMQILRQKQVREAPALDPIGIPLLKPLGDLCMRLLARKPEKRPTYPEIRMALGASTVPEPSSTNEQLLGREPQLEVLRNCFSQVQEHAQPMVVFVSGRSGEGKSALVTSFLNELKSNQQVTVLSGRCYDRESVPFKALDSLIDALASYLRTLDPIQSAVLLPDDTGILAKVFPVLSRVELIAKRPAPEISSLDEPQIRKRAFAALKELLRRLAVQTPLVLFCDDLQWGDSDSAQAVMDVFSGQGIPKLLLIGSFRVDELESSLFLQTWTQGFSSRENAAATVDVEVGPLQRSECAALIRTRFADFDEGQVSRLVDELLMGTAGNAFFVTEILDSLTPEGNNLRRIPLARVLNEKLKTLTSEAPEILEVISINGQALKVGELLETVNHKATAHATLTAMRNLRLIRFLDDSEHGRIDTYHDKIRETVLSDMSNTQRTALHARLGAVIERRATEIDQTAIDRIMDGHDVTHRDIERIYDLSFHFLAAGERRKAAAYSLLAAEQAERQYSPEVAAERFRMASQNLELDSTKEIRFRCAKGLGRAEMLLGNYREAEQALAGILDLTSDETKKASAELVLAEVNFKQAKLEESKAYCVSGLARLGEWVPQSSLGYAYAILRDVSIQAFHSIFLEKLKRQPDTTESQLTANLMTQLTYVNCFNSVPMMAWSVTRAMNIGERFTPNNSLIAAYILHASISIFAIGWKSRGDFYFRKASEINKGMGNLWSNAHSTCWQGVSSFGCARYRQGAELLEDACRQFEQIGDAWEANFARFHLGMCYFALGELEQARRIQESTCTHSIAIGDSRALCSSYGWSRASEGTLPLADISSRLPEVPGDYLSTINHRKAVGYWHLANGRADKAIEMFDSALGIMLTHKHFQVHTFAILPLLAAALRTHAIQLDDPKSTERKRLLKRAHKLSYRASLLGVMFPTERAASLREYALVLEALGNTKKAIKTLEKSCNVAGKQEEAYELARSRFELARIQHEYYDGSATSMNEAEAELEGFLRIARSDS